jgi:transcriptional regulator with XRE-family HTH domain
MAIFGDRLKEARILKGWNQEDLAKAMNLTQASISQFESGQRLPTPKNIEKFSEILNVSREYLAGDNNGDFEREILMRNLKNISPESIKIVSDLIESLKKKS